MKIDLETARYYSGLGDLVMLACLAEGARASGEPLVFHRKRDLSLAEMVGLPIDPEPGGMSLDSVFATEVADGCRKPRLDYIREFLGLRATAVRPSLRIPADDEAWAEHTSAELGSPLALLFPQTAWRPREWPSCYWVDLSWKLKAAGIAVLLMYQGDDERYRNTPHYHWNMPVPRIAALMKRAALVIGNDSFPAHLSGAMGRPTLVLLGPTQPMVFGHLPGVECLASSLIECTGCHFRAPFRPACDQGCQSLYRLYPEMVFNRALARLHVAR